MRWTLFAIAALILLPTAAAQNPPAYRLEGDPPGLIDAPRDVMVALTRVCQSAAGYLDQVEARVTVEAKLFKMEAPAAVTLPEAPCALETKQVVAFKVRLSATNETPRMKPLLGTVRVEVPDTTLTRGGSAELQMPAALGPASNATLDAAPEGTAAAQASPAPGPVLLAGLAVAAFAARRRAPGQG